VPKYKANSGSRTVGYHKTGLVSATKKHLLTYNCGEDEDTDEVADDRKHVPEIDEENTS
jgi:hypothetical protein